jgi:hypothetical protein
MNNKPLDGALNQMAKTLLTLLNRSFCAFALVYVMNHSYTNISTFILRHFAADLCVKGCPIFSLRNCFIWFLIS